MKSTHGLVLERLLEARSRGDVEAVLAECTEDVTYEVMGDLAGQPMISKVAGKVALRAAFSGLFGRWIWQDVKMVHVVIGEVSAAVELAGTKLHSVTNQKFHSKFCHVFEFRAGMVCAIREYVDTFQIIRLSGLAM